MKLMVKIGSNSVFQKIVIAFSQNNIRMFCIPDKLC